MSSSIKTASQLNPTDHAPVRRSISGTGVTLEGIEIAYNLAYVEYVNWCDFVRVTLDEGGEFTDDMAEHAEALSERLGALDRAMGRIADVLAEVL